MYIDNAMASAVNETMRDIRLALWRLVENHDCHSSPEDGCRTCSEIDDLTHMIDMAVHDIAGHPIREEDKHLEKLWATV